ncbi:Gfo/Idh/MocA family protein [Blastococcus deserti]|uniref:Gfo/Idh/MocA family protein n=1 Tax=Blastococcus deserti TaxID=2259033 RepID=A0ABW4XCN5_9ACTN
MSHPDLGPARVVAWWGQDPELARQWADRTGVERVVDRPEVLVGQVDAVLICTWRGSDHAALARPFLRAGVPVFVDKPFTESIPEARELVAIAEETGAVLFTSSPWKWSPAVGEVHRRAHELGGLRTCVATGPYVDGPFFYVTHMVETGQFLLGTGAATVCALETEAARVITVTYRSGEVLVVNALRDTSAVRQVTLYGKDGYLEADINEAQKEVGMVEMLAVFLRAARTGRPPLSYEHPVEATAVMAAAQHSIERGGVPVALDTLLRPQWGPSIGRMSNEQQAY